MPRVACGPSRTAVIGACRGREGGCVATRAVAQAKTHAEGGREFVLYTQEESEHALRRGSGEDVGFRVQG